MACLRPKRRTPSSEFGDEHCQSVPRTVLPRTCFGGTRRDDLVQAGFRTAHTLEVPANVTAIKLPPYSPELNPVENLWHSLRSHHWSNRDYDNYDALIQATTHAWQQAALIPETTRTV